jgi:hypothetical protein
MIEETMDKKLGGIQERLLNLESKPRQTTKKLREDEAYWNARHSLRMAPITNPDLRVGVIEFVEKVLDSEPSVVNQLPNSSFRRAPPNRNSKIKNEVIVCFANAQDRDYIKSQGFKLAGKNDHRIFYSSELKAN